ncbi:MFS transporter [Bordetella genomosp. 10]|uniref:MFS transporter n=2 Tax=Bordetella genomosp. 10 TaxID=1416804 RepID=A0A261SDQ9_9BORD|nr:MFS transporter [Bordetella genomosp. 10]
MTNKPPATLPSRRAGASETSATPPHTGQVSQRKIRQVLAASIVGTIIEWYDFVLFGVAAGLVFNRLFFPSLSPVAGTLAAFLTLGVGFLARPIGGLVISHFGDKKGRKPALIFTIALMGTSTLAIGFLPTYDHIGIMAPILLVLLRMLQGLGAGAEYAGALILVAEYVPERRKGYYTAYVLSATVVGLLLATLVFRAIAQLPEQDMLSWGWRVPFFLSAILVVLALYIRRRLEETPEYVNAVSNASAAKQAAVPLREVLGKQPKTVLYAFLAMAGANAVTYLINTFALSYMVNNLGFDKIASLNVIIVASIAGIVCTPIMGAVADRFGYGRVYALGTAFILVYAAPMFWLMDTRSILMATLALVIAYGIGFGSVAGSQGAFLTSLFPARYRFSGIAFVREINGATVAGMTPFIATWLTGQAGGKSTYLIAYLICLCVISVLAIVALRNNRQPADQATT